MLPLTPATLRACFVNASKKERSDAWLPDLDALDWDALDLLGWRDAKLGRRSYVVVPTDGGGGAPVGVLLRQAEASPRSRTQCAWCADVRLPNPVVMVGARLAGPAGRAGGTVGTLVCEDFQCSANVRTDPPLPYEGFDVARARAERVDALRTRAAGFVRAVTTR
ncbi:FBP domain-containing protein [Pseudokineococcus basanitobsidens]|uniref:FBP domain-containing protein n=1 Tax=Pseudokineococcus basanitobsidens TaxID=1926649 RepID=A0ABU8RLU3_9ACTN